MKKVIAIFNLVGVALIIIPTLNAQVSTIEKVDPCITCEQLMDLQLPDVTITSTEKVVEGNPHCRILGVIGREIKFELLLPEKWNARFFMDGRGGFAGSVRAPRYELSEGYATSSTDTGHEGNAAHGDWALNNMERQVNYAHLAVHRTAVVSKAIINEYYGQFPDFNYFIGHSNGGKQAMIEAQRYPEDFDGIVAGAPAMNFSRWCAKLIRNSQIMFPDPENLDIGIISEAQLEILQDAVLEQCDEIDGIKDNIINDPRDCKFDFSNLPNCSESIEDTVCFTPEQIEAIKMLYAELTIQGKEVYPEYPIGSEIVWWGWVAGPSENSIKNWGFPTLHYAFGTEWFKYMIFNDPEWDYSSYDFSNYFNESEFAYSNFSATSTDYQAFNNLGGKLIIYHGWCDAAISANASIEHFEAVKTRDPSVDNYLKLYLLPGVIHGNGGYGPSEIDWMEIIRNWVENENPPDRIVVSKFENDKLKMTRPVYPYPRISVYDGSGDPNVESSFIEKK